MSYAYKIIVVDFAKIDTECNTLGQKGWELVTAYPSNRANCCNQNITTTVLIFKQAA